MPALTMEPTETKSDFSHVAVEANPDGKVRSRAQELQALEVMRPATASAAVHAVDVAVDFMDEYAGVFTELAK